MSDFSTALCLAGVHPDFLKVLFLMLQCDRFLDQIGGNRRYFDPMVSPNVAHIFALLEITCDFPFFPRSTHLKMLAYSGASMLLVRKICRPITTIFQSRDMKNILMQMIYDRIVSHTLHKLNCERILENSLTKVAEYFEQNVEFFSIHIIPPPFFLPHLNSFSKVMSLVLVLPDSSFELENLSTNDLTDQQVNAYNTIHLLCAMRHMYRSENTSFIEFCIFYDEHISTQSSNEGRGVHGRARFYPSDHQAFMDLVNELLALFFPKEEHGRDDHQRCIQIFDFFYESMRRISDWNSISLILTSQDEIYIKNRLAGFPFQFKNDTFRVDLGLPLFDESLEPPVELNIDVFNFLKKARRVVVPESILQVLSSFSNQKFESDAESQLYRLMFIFLKFLKFIQADTLECNFVFTCFVALHSGLPFWVCDIYIDLQGWQAEYGENFYEFFSDFCEFANPRMHCIQMRKKSFLSFFKLMRDVLFDKQFISQLSEFLEEVKKVEDRHMVVGMCNSRVRRSVIQLLHELYAKIVPFNYPFIESMLPPFKLI